MEDFNEGEIESELDRINDDIKGKTSIDNPVGIHNNRVMALFDRIFPEKEKKAMVRNNVKWFDSETKSLSQV